MNLCRKLSLATLAMLATVVGASAAEKNTKPTPAPQAAATVDKSDLQKLIEQFKSRRDALLANRDALLNQLKNATTEQRQAILEKMQDQQKQLMDAQRALGRQLRDEMRKLRQSTPAGPGRH